MNQRKLACIVGLLAAVVGTVVFLLTRARDGGVSPASIPHDADSGSSIPSAVAPRALDVERSEVVDPAVDAATVPVTEREAPTPSEGSGQRAIVISRLSGGPLDGAAVHPMGRVNRAIDATDLREPLATGGADGRLTLPPSESPDRTLLVTAPDHAPALATFGAVHVPPGPPLEVVLAGAAVLRGTVVLVGDGTGDVTSLSVVLRARAGDVAHPRWSLSWGGDVEWSARVDELGGFEISSAVPGVSLVAEVQRAGEVLWASPERLRLAESSVREVTWEIGHTADVVIRAVEADGGPAAELDIALDVAPQKGRRYERSLGPRARKALTGQDGTHVFEDVPVGPWCVSVSAEQSRPEGAAPAPALVRFDVESLSERVEVELPVHRGLYIRGVVEDWEGVPLPRETVQAIGDGDDGGSMLGRADAGGNFSVGPLLPGGYRLRAGTFGRGTNAPAIPVPAVAGQEGVVVRLQRGGILAGRVVDAETGEPLACRVSQRSTGGGGYRSSVEDGVFDMDGIAPGVCALVVATNDGRKALLAGIELAPGQEIRGLVIDVEAAAFVDLHYLGDAERIYAEIESSGVRIDGQWITSGSSGRLAVPPCTLDVKLQTRDPGGELVLVETLTAKVAPGESKRIDLSLVR